MECASTTAEVSNTTVGASLLSVEDLHVHFVTSRGVIRAVEGVNWRVYPGEMVALVGESGCGKSVSALAVMRLLAKPAGRVAHGRILFEGRNLLALSEDDMREVRGRDISMIFQEPMTSLNPVLTIGLQIMEPLFMHKGMNEAQATSRALELLRMVGISDAERRLGQYPHQFSGGMRQRVMIAIGLACNPKLIIADEPTTALDVTIQAQILHLMKELSRELGIAMVVITHNLGIVARYADRVNVMYAARMAEQGTAASVFARPLHPYTVGLLRSVPRLDRPRGAKLETIEGLPPSLLTPPKGCRFAPRCPAKQEACELTLPEPEEIEPRHFSACLRARELAHRGPQGIGLVSAECNATGPAQDAECHPVARSARAQDLVRRAARRAWRRSCGAARGRRRVLRDTRRRDAGAGGRVRMRQDDRGPNAAAPGAARPPAASCTTGST